MASLPTLLADALRAHGLETPSMMASLSCAFFITSFFSFNMIIMPMVSSLWKGFSGADRAFISATHNSTLNAVVAASMALQVGYTYGVGVHLYSLPLSFSSPESTALACMVIGYLSADLLFCLTYTSQWPGWQATIGHHVFGILSFGVLVADGSGHGLILAAIILEFTNPIVNTRYLMDKFQYRETYPTLYIFVGAMMTLGFFILRICFFSYAGYYNFTGARLTEFLEWDSTLAQVVTIISYTFGIGLQYFWFFKIMKGLLKLLFGPKKSKGL